MEVLPDFVIENVAYGNDNLLNLLGITNTSVYLSNCSIWVEGITDRLYVQRILSQYLLSTNRKSKYDRFTYFQEGVNYSFALTAGDSIIHWDFSDAGDYGLHKENIIVKKFCGKSLLIVDSDFGKNLSRKETLSNLLGQRFVELPVPEIENILSIEQIMQTILTYPSISNTFKNIDNFPKIADTALKEKKVGFIIDEMLLINAVKVKHFSSGDGRRGSLKTGDKLDFCRRAIEFIQPNTLTNDAIWLAERVLEFVIVQNKNFIAS